MTGFVLQGHVWSAWSLGRGCWHSIYTALSFSHWYPVQLETVARCFCSTHVWIKAVLLNRVQIMETNIIHLSDSLQTWKTNPALRSLVFQSFRRLSVNPARGFSHVYAVGWGWRPNPVAALIPRWCSAEVRSAGVDQFLSLSEAEAQLTFLRPSNTMMKPLQSCETQASLITFISKWTPNKPTSLCYGVSGPSSWASPPRAGVSVISLAGAQINKSRERGASGSSQHCLTVTGLLNG